MLSRIDGESAIDELADVLGMSEDEVDAAIGRLDLLGAIEWHDRASHGARTRHVSPPPVNRPPVAPRMPERPIAPPRAPERPLATRQPSVPPPRTPTPPIVAPVIDEVDFDPERRARIDFLTSKLEGLDHYSLLGLGSDAEKNDIRNAYFGLSKQFHPDTAFGKKLGPYKGRMEAIFNRLTEAYDVLSKAKRRAEYDESLKRRGQFPISKPTIPPAGAIEPNTPRGEPKSGSQSLGRAPSEPPRPVAPPVPVPVVHEAKAPPLSPSPSQPAVRALPETPRPPIPAPQPPPREERRAPIAPTQASPRVAAPAPPQVTQQAPQSARTPTPPASPRPGDTPQRVVARPQGPAGHTLRNLASTLKAAGQVTGSTDRVQRYLKDARAAEAENDFSQALNCLRLARQLAPDRTDLATEYERVYRVFVTTHADDLRRRALADEKAGKLAEATQAWLRVCDGRPNDLEAYYAAGRAALASRTELPRTRGYMQRAVSIAPHVPEGRVLLARLYLANGQKPEAVREAESAAKLYPDDQMLKNLIRELKA